MDDLENRVQQFGMMQLPGQPMGMHMGTSYLVNDLWREVQKLRAELKAAEQGVQSDVCPVCGGDGIQVSGVRGPRPCIPCDGTGKRR